MKKAIILVVGLLALSATTAFAQSGLNLYVGDCGGGTTTSTVTNACTTNTGTAMTLVGSIVLPSSMADFVGCAAIVDVQTDAATIPDWWRGDGAGCRSGAITGLMDATVSPSSSTVWDGLSNILPVFAVQPNDPTRTGNDVPVSRVRLNMGAAQSSTTGSALTADGSTELGVVKFTITKAKSVGAGACTGCATPACIVLNEINIQPVSTSEPWIRITNALGNNHIAYNNGLVLACPSAVPVKNHTWGEIKALYR